MTERTLAKAVTADDRSDAVVVSFAEQWYERLRCGEFSLVIRKRVPTRSTPRWLYFHINAPKSAICARAEIVEVGQISLSNAIAENAKIALGKDEIRNYVGTHTSVGCYRLGQVELAPTEATLGALARRLVYHPPQSFFVLSKQARQVVDSLCGFNPEIGNAAKRKVRA